jgi:hypothetical protein
MTARRTYILAGLLTASLFCHADSPRGAELSFAEYRAHLDQLSVATQQLDSSGRPVPPILKEVPPSWRVHTDQQDFEISAEGLQRDVRRFEQQKTVTTASAVRSRIQSLINDVDGFQSPPQDVTRSRDRLTSLLARPEFRAVRGPSFFDRLKQRLIAALIRMLEFLFRSSAIPTISKFFVYGLIGLAVLTLGFIAYRQIRSASEQEKVVPVDVPVSARNWALWLAQARAAAAQNNWREAIHLAYWAGISFLELKGAWRPDRARTPREYLRLLSKSSEHRETLAALTHMFELAWYAKQEADAASYSQMMQALERLGCQSS